MINPFKSVFRSSREVPGRIYQKIYRFFYWEPAWDTVNNPIIDSNADQSVKPVHIEWNLKQHYADIYHRDLSVIGSKLAPGFVKEYIASWRRFILYYFYLDDLEERDPVSSQILETFPSASTEDGAHLLAVKNKRSTWSRCYTNFIYKFKTIHSLVSSAVKFTGNRIVRKIPGGLQVLHSLIQHALTGRAGKFKIILAYLYHKRI